MELQKRRARALQARDQLRVAANDFAHALRLGKLPGGWLECTHRGQCGRCGYGDSSPNPDLGARLFRRTWFVPLLGSDGRPITSGRHRLGTVHSTPNLCVSCAVRELQNTKPG